MVRVVRGVIGIGVLAGCNATHSKYGHAYESKHKANPVVDCQVPECPEGFIRKGGYCVQGEIVAKEESCPEGTYNDDGMCIMSMDGTAVCKKGVDIGGLFCEIKEVVNSRLSCPDGSVDQGDQCFVGGLVEYCPPGTAKTSEGKCLTTVAKEFFCPPHLKDIGGICVDYEYENVIEVCPEDTELENGKCVAKVEREAVCPKGFADQGERCAAFETPIRDVCEDGYAYDGDELVCIKSAYVDAVPECPDGGKLIEGYCTKYIEGPTGPVCEEGFLVENLCHVQSATEPDFVCPESYELENTPQGPICTKSVPYDCSVPCDKGHHKDVTHGHNKAYGRKLEQVEGFGHGTKIHSKGHYHHAMGICSGIDPIEPKTCYEAVVADVIPVCPKGSTYDGVGGCIVKDVYPPKSECLADTDAHGKCVIEQRYKPVFYCPDGTTPIGDGTQCEWVDFEQPAIRCPEGTEEYEGKCAVFVEKACPEEGCYETVTWIPDVACPLEFTLVLYDLAKGKKNHKHEERCVKEAYVKQWTTCPEGFTPLDDDTCGMYKEPVIRSNEVIIKAQEICPIGYAAVECGGRCDSFFVCERVNYAPAELNCPEDFYPVIGTEVCARQVPVIHVCPKGSEEVNGDCTITIRTDPLVKEFPGVVVPVKKTKKGSYTTYPKTSNKPVGGYPVKGGYTMPSSIPKNPTLKTTGSWGAKKWALW